MPSNYVPKGYLHIKKDRERRNMTPLTKEQSDLVAKFTPLAFRIFRNFQNKFPDLITEDDCDAGFFTLIRCARGYKENKKVKFITYAYIALVRTFRGLIGKNKRRIAQFNDENTDAVYLDTKSDYEFDEIEKVRKLIDRLPENERLAIKQHYFDKLNYKEIGRNMKVSGEMVRVYIKHAKERIKRSMTAGCI